MPAIATPASLVRRINATTLDGIVCIAIIGAAQVIPGDGAPLRALRVACIWAPVFLLDPLLIRFTGATFGQRWLDLRTAPLGVGARLTLPRLVLRYWIKLLLGFVSLAYVVFSGRRQALHDRVFGTLVWHAPADAALPVQGSWQPPLPDPALPPPWVRFPVFIAWSLVAQTAFTLTFVVGAYSLFPTTGERLPVEVEFALNVSSVALELWLLSRAVNGRLPGARRRAVPAPASL
jgi:uncharacterized RDD family membrane protein YckC